MGKQNPTIAELQADAKAERKKYEALRVERDALKATVERIRHPKVYEGATFYTQADVPDICPECDGRNFISYEVKGMVCLACCLMRDLEEAEATVARLDWQPITPENLPKVGDEVLDRDGSTASVDSSDCSVAEEWGLQYWRRVTHFRPINAPILAARATPPAKP